MGDTQAQACKHTHTHMLVHTRGASLQQAVTSQHSHNQRCVFALDLACVFALDLVCACPRVFVVFNLLCQEGVGLNLPFLHRCPGACGCGSHMDVFELRS